MNNRLRIAAVAVMATAFATAAFGQQDIYTSKCQMCHGADGLGQTPAGKAMKVPAVSDFLKGSDADLIAATKAGKGKMPAYAGKLTDPQIKATITYMRTLKK